MENIMKVLIIEDVPTDAMLIERIIKKEFPGSCFCRVETREDFIQALGEFAPELILSDYTLPAFDGMSALKIALDKVPDIPFIIVTGSINEETAAECIKSGAWDYVLKDHLMRLNSAVHHSLEQKKIRLERKLALQSLHESEERYRSIFEVASACIVVHSEGTIRMMNPAGLKLFGAKSEDEIIGKPILDLLGPSTLERVNDRIQRMRNGESEVYPVEDVFLKLDGTPFDVEVLAAPLTYNDRPAVQVIMTDITMRKEAELEQKRLQEALYQEKEYLKNLIQNASTPIIIWTPDYVITEFNHAFEELTGYTRADMIGQRIDQTKTAIGSDLIMRSIIRSKNGWTCHNKELSFSDREGNIQTVLWSSANINDSKGNYIATIVQGTDITERKKAEEENLYMSYHDHLTDLYNRRFFEYKLKELIEEEQLPLSIIMGDINGLKLINDSFGHEAGDDLLRKAAQVIRKGCRKNDIIARIGGDEFGIILMEADGENAEEVVKRIKEEAAMVEFDNTLLSISFGYATLHDTGRKLQDVLIEAENFMYQRKMYESVSMRNKTIDIIMNALYEKSDRELHHSQRVSRISAEIAEQLGFNADEVNKIRISGLVHDIGKIGISEKILNKPDKLDESEWALIKKHPEAGWRILSSAKEFSDLAKQILHHHERWDGNGYPEGLKGDNIPIEARIITVADAYDAMTSKRAYRDSLQKDDVIDQLVRCSGSQFDPKIIDVFLNKVLNKGSETCSRTGDNP